MRKTVLGHLVLRMWRDDEYDNFKDGIQDLKSLLRRAQSGLPKVATKLERALKRATTELAKLAERDPAIAEYAEGLIDPKYLARMRRPPSTIPAG